MTPRNTLIVVMVVLSLLAPVTTVGATTGPSYGAQQFGVTDSHAESNSIASAEFSTSSQLNESEILMWTKPTRIDADVGQNDVVDMSNADSQGRLHIAYSNNNELFYVRITTRGTIQIQKQIATENVEIGNISVVTEPTGWVHILYQTQSDVSPRIKRITIAPNGSVVMEYQVASNYRLFDAEADKFGLIRVLVDDNGNTLELWTLHNRSQTQTSRVVNSYAPDGPGTPSLAIRESTLAILYDRKDDREYDDTFVRLFISIFDLSQNSITRETDHEIDDTWRKEWGIGDIAIQSTGRIAISFAKLGTIQIYDQSGEKIGSTDAPQATVAELLFDRNDRLFGSYKTANVLRTKSGYLRFSSAFTLEKENGAFGGELGLNRHGFPSLLSRGESGKLEYRAMIIRTTGEYKSLYAKFDSINEALIKENIRLKQRINELENRSETVVINVTVTAQGEREALVAGSTALVTVGTIGINPTQVSLQFGDTVYTPNESGQAVIALSTAGEQPLTVSYKNASETINLNVRPPVTPTPSPSPTFSPTPSSNPSPTKSPLTSPSPSTTQQATTTILGEDDATSPADSDNDGVPNSEDYAPRDPSVQDKSDLQTQTDGQPGFGFITIILTIIGILIIARWRSITI